MAAEAGDRLRFIEGMRGLAALYVALGHFCSIVDPLLFFGGRSIAQPWQQAAMAPFGYGHLAVAAFITISGFCLQLALFGRGDGRLGEPKKFFRRRAMRILPPYYACLALSLVVALWITPLGQGMPYEQYLPVTWENVAAHLFMVHNLDPAWMYKINGVLWSIAIEAQLYLVFPLLVWLLWRFGRIGTVALSIVGSAAMLLLIPNGMKLYPWYLALFALGMAAAHLALMDMERAKRFAGAGLVVCVVALALCIASTAIRLEMPWRDALIGIASAAAMFAGTAAPTLRFTAWLGSKPLAWLGLISYSLYLMHHPILQPLYLFRPAWAQGPARALAYLLIVGLPVILLACWGFWWLFERPYLRSRRAELAQPAAPQPSTA